MYTSRKDIKKRTDVINLKGGGFGLNSRNRKGGIPNPSLLRSLQILRFRSLIITKQHFLRHGIHFSFLLNDVHVLTDDICIDHTFYNEMLINSPNDGSMATFLLFYSSIGCQLRTVLLWQCLFIVIPPFPQCCHIGDYCKRIPWWTDYRALLPPEGRRVPAATRFETDGR